MFSTLTPRLSFRVTSVLGLHESRVDSGLSCFGSSSGPGSPRRLWDRGLLLKYGRTPSFPAQCRQEFPPYASTSWSLPSGLFLSLSVLLSVSVSTSYAPCVCHILCVCLLLSSLSVFFLSPSSDPPSSPFPPLSPPLCPLSPL